MKPTTLTARTVPAMPKFFIPAHEHSTRLPNKLLLPSPRTSGAPLLHDTVTNLLQYVPAEKIYIATDSDKIIHICKRFAWQYVRTGEHFSGSQRVLDAVTTLGLSHYEIVVNYQADEVEFPTAHLTNFFQTFQQFQNTFGNNSVGTFIAPLTQQKDFNNPHIVKVVGTSPQEAYAFFTKGLIGQYFSRAPVPYFLSESAFVAWQHIGIYCCQARLLEHFVSNPHVENLEQLNPLFRGNKFYCHIIPDAPLQINTKEDYDAYTQKVHCQH